MERLGLCLIGFLVFSAVSAAETSNEPCLNYRLICQHIESTENCSKYQLENTLTSEICELKLCEVLTVSCLEDNKWAGNCSYQLLRNQGDAVLPACAQGYCESDTFQHDYIINNHEQIPHTNSWKRTKIGELSTLQDLCLQASGLPVTRRCEVHNGLARWEFIGNWPPVLCFRQYRESSISLELNNLFDDILERKQLLNSSQERSRTTARLGDIFRQSEKIILPVDVYIAGQVLSELMAQPADETIATDLVGICSEIMSSEDNVLEIAAQLNATNTVLSKFESYMDALTPQLVPSESCGIKPSMESVKDEVEVLNFADLGVQARISSRLSVFYVNPECSNITGIAVYSAAGKERLQSSKGFWYRFLYSWESVEAVMQERNLETGSFMAEELWQQLQHEGASYIILKIYDHDALFVDTSRERRNRRPGSKILSLSIPGFKDRSLPNLLPIILRANDNFVAKSNLGQVNGCGYWNYTTWLTEGISTNLSTEWKLDPIVVCHTSHLTPFSFVLQDTHRGRVFANDVLISPLQEHVLDIISLLGCSLSLLGMVCILLTALCCRRWRQRPSTKLLLNLCLAIALELILFLLISLGWTTKSNRISCMMLGAALQYSILVLFSWMLIIATLQYQRYVIVLGVEQPGHYILRSAMLAWLLPLIPTLLSYHLDPESYVGGNSDICYASGYALSLGLLLPLAVIVAANLLIFIYIFYSVSQHIIQLRENVLKLLRLFVFLFFLLGLCWIFGILMYLELGEVFSYLFCLTATLQGFVLFLSTLLDEEVQSIWRRVVCLKRKQLYEVQGISGCKQSVSFSK